MKTSKEMQLKIIDKMRENVGGDLFIYKYVEVLVNANNPDSFTEITNPDYALNFKDFKYRVKPQTITINGVEIPKPLGSNDIKSGIIYYYVDNNKSLYEHRFGEFIHLHGIRFVYATKQEAITASKALFGIKGE